VVGRVEVTAYGGDAGEPLSAQDVGLTTIDAIQLRMENESTGPGTSGRTAAYSKDTGHFYVFLVSEAGARTVFSGTTTNLEFVAEGDSAHNVELT
jgi:hypothetical protein